MKKWVFVVVIILLGSAGTLTLAAERTWNFDNDAEGNVLNDFIIVTGKWGIVKDNAAPTKPNVIAQTAKNQGDYFNVAILDNGNYEDVELSVDMRAFAGEEDQGGGLIWRFRDIKNYYVVRYNPLEDNFRVYKVVRGNRIQLQSAGIKQSTGWHKIKVEMKGNHIKCYYDDRKYLEVRDDTFKEAGKIGLWTKADAITYFDNFIVKNLE
ncbi:MAG: hypothetical protein Q6359_06565 [Candidatus Brocadiales bacterium]|nr:hypothetical protein [Candidatus Brocadiales bacterium]